MSRRLRAVDHVAGVSLILAIVLVVWLLPVVAEIESDSIVARLVSAVGGIGLFWILAITVRDAIQGYEGFKRVAIVLFLLFFAFLSAPLYYCIMVYRDTIWAKKKSQN